LSLTHYPEQFVLGKLECDEVWHVCSALDTCDSAFALSLDQLSRSPLGKYAETLIGTWLSLSRYWTLRAAHGQVQQGVRTLGEFDFLVHPSAQDLESCRRDGLLEHWEFSVNFFLCASHGDGMVVGPNLVDTLEQKCQRVFDRQLRLTSLPEFVALYGAGWRSRAIFQGWIFFDLDCLHRTPLAAPSGVSSLAPSGVWCQNSEPALAQLTQLGAAHGVSHWLVADKAMWIAPRLREDFPSSMWERRVALDPAGALQRWLADVGAKPRDVPLVLGMAEGQEVLRAFVRP
jgi:uncharacterized protein